MLTVGEEMIQGAAGRLFVRSWFPQQIPRAVVVICHGFNAHSGMYLGAGRRLSDQAIAVFALDLRGRGRSDGERFYVECFGDYVEDVERLVAVAKERHPGLPLFMIGHSAGALIALAYALDHADELRGLVCESPTLGLSSSFALGLVSALRRVAPRLRAGALDNKAFSRDWTFVATMNFDPLIAGEAQPLATLQAQAVAAARIRAELPSFRTPILLLQGSMDRLAPPEVSQGLYDQCGSLDRSRKLYHARLHDLFNDWGGDEVLDDVLAWIRLRETPARPTS